MGRGHSLLSNAARRTPVSLDKTPQLGVSIVPVVNTAVPEHNWEAGVYDRTDTDAHVMEQG